MKTLKHWRLKCVYFQVEYKNIFCLAFEGKLEKLHKVRLKSDQNWHLLTPSKTCMTIQSVAHHKHRIMWYGIMNTN